MVISARVASSSHMPLWPFAHAGGPIPLTLENGGAISVVHAKRPHPWILEVAVANHYIVATSISLSILTTCTTSESRPS